MTETIAIIGAACRYPDAGSPAELWETVLARRRAFRPIPAVRLSPADYCQPGDPDGTYVRFAAVLEGWEFDRSRYLVPGQTHRVTDHTHWLALDVAGQTLAAAGFPDGSGLARDKVGVVLGNTLTGEFSRAALMRLRWPYVRRVLAGALAADHGPADVDRLIGRIERSYKAPFPEPNDESLAGGMANTIAGRICNHFDLHGGGYVVDGACSSSLLAVITACRALAAGELDLAIAGGVDLSLDPFELVGFARVGALAESRMRVYDAHPTGFLPGEGCGMVALVRAEDARAGGHEPLALIRGWGVSSDGHGGITRPEAAGQAKALERAYEMAGFPPSSVMLFEGHGTGTAAGDRAELEALTTVRAGVADRPSAIGSIKANIGHTKAAAGVAGLLKAALAVSNELIPPTTGCDEPHELLDPAQAPLRVATQAEAWPSGPIRAGVSAMGFGGINTHVVLESATTRRRRPASAETRRIASGPLSHEVFTFRADTTAELATVLERTVDRAASMSLAEHCDLAASLAAAASKAATDGYRIALVATDPATLSSRARQALHVLPALSELAGPGLLTGPGMFGGHGQAGRVGLLFTGQGGSPPARAGALGVVYPPARDQIYRPPADVRRGQAGHYDTSVTQPAILAASMAGLRWLDQLGVEAHAAAGHSLGEISALCWAGVLSRADALGLAEFRGAAMADLCSPGTGMVSVAADADVVARLIDGTDLAISAYNGNSLVVGGPAADCERLAERARNEGWRADRLKVSHAFHTSAVAAAAPPLAAHLAGLAMAPPVRSVYSTVTGRLLGPGDDLRELLTAQVTAPVLFQQAVESLAADCQLLVELGPGQVLASLARGITPVPALALDVGARTAEGLSQVAAALFAIGAADDLTSMFAPRFHRPFDLWREPTFLANACELAPEVDPPVAPAAQSPDPVPAPVDDGGLEDAAGPLVRRLVAEAIELPAEAVGEDDRLLSDLHLGSLAVARLATQAAVQCAKASPAPLALGDVTVGELAAAVDALPGADGQAATAASTTGVAPWFRVLEERLVPADRPEPGRTVSPFGWSVRGRGRLRADVEPLLEYSRAGTPAVAFFLPENPDDADLTELVETTRAAIADGTHLAVVDEGDSAAGFVGTINSEYPKQTVGLVKLARPRAAGVAAEAIAQALAATPAPNAGPRGGDPPHPPSLRQVNTPIIIDSGGRPSQACYQPVKGQLAPSPAEGVVPLGPDDVVLITGGGKGIGFETALALGQQTGVKVALLGRSDPASDSDLAANLTRLREAGIRCCYRSADVTDPGQAGLAIRALVAELGPVTALIHATGVNQPARFADLTAADFARHLAPKSQGLRTVLDNLEASRLRILITYGSVIGTFGLVGEAHYALANGQLRETVRTLATELPQCWVCNVDWTAWTGAGMGERLDVIDDLVRLGVAPLPAAEGTRLLLQLLATRPAVASVLITGRLPGLDRELAPSPTPRRFVREVLVHTPGVELIAESKLTLAGEDYLADHVIDDLYVLPAVVTLEAMSQAARALTGDEADHARSIEDARFDRAVVIPSDGTRTIRVCALVRADGDIDVVLRSDETAFATDHASGRVSTARQPELAPMASHVSPLPAHEGKDLYGPLFFHGPRFRRLHHYCDLEATKCTALLSAGGAYASPAGLDAELGDPARNDATIHVLQACVPHQRLLPIGCQRFTVHSRDVADDMLVLTAQERWHEGAEYGYDIQVRDGDRLVVSWQDLKLREVSSRTAIRRWPPVLLGPYLQRVVTALMGGSAPQIRLVPSAVREGAPCPEVTESGSDPQANGASSDQSQLDGLTLTARGAAPVRCDWRPVRAEPDSDQTGGPLDRGDEVDGLTRLIAEPEHHARARVRAVRDCLAKMGRAAGEPLAIRGVYEQGWAMLGAGSLLAASVIIAVDGQPEPIVITVLVEETG